MREAGIEPARGYPHRILSPVCLPVPPLSHSWKPLINQRSGEGFKLS